MSRRDVIYIFLLFVTSVFCSADDSWLLYQSDVLDSNREELVIKGVDSHENFNLPYKIEKWRGLSLGPVFYSVGVTENGIVVLKNTLNDTKDGFSTTTYKMDLDNEPSDIALHHNRINGTSQLVIIVSYANDSSIDWFNVNDVAPSKFWTWKLDHPVLHINTFKIKGRSVLLHLQAERNDTTATLYEFNLRGPKPKRRFLDSLEIIEPASSSALIAFDDVHYLSIPQTRSDLVLVFRHDGHRFEPYRNLRAGGVANVASFRISVRSYLTVDGFDAGIYWFGDDRIVKQKVVNGNLDGISFWLPIPVETYREDVVLLAERSLDHGTHTASTVEVITNNGGKFEEHVDVQCSHFGQDVNSLECMIRDSNLVGSSYISIGETVGVLMPRKEIGLELFVMSYEIRSLPHPKERNINSMVEQIEYLKKSIQNRLLEQENLKRLMEDITTNLNNETPVPIVAASNSVEARVEEIGAQIEELRQRINGSTEEEIDFNGRTLIINGTVEFRGGLKAKVVEVEEIDGENATNLLHDIVGKFQSRPISGVKTFLNLTVEELNFTVANGVRMDELVVKNETVELTGNVIFDKPVEAGNAFGDGIDLTNIVDTRNYYDGELVFEEIEVSGNFEAETINGQNGSFDSLVFPGNVSVTFINGVNFSQFVRELCFTNLKCHIPGNVTVLGNITAEYVESQYLNDLKFPEEYILNDDVPYTNITGTKFFKRLTAREIRTTGTISGVDTDTLFTLSTDQTIEGKMTFADLELTEELNVTGKIIGESIQKFLKNPSLKDTYEIKANVNFRDLEVDGKIIVENNFNGQNLEELLKSIVYKDEEKVEIHATKEFPFGLTVKENLEIESGSINSVELDSLVTKDTEQDLNISLLNGDVTIKNLIVFGRFDGRNITELDENLVKLTGDQFISSTLIFNEDVRVENLEVIETLNGLEADQYVSVDEDTEIDRSLRFQNISVENLYIQGDLHGEIAGVDWKEVEAYLSYTKDQTIDADYEIGSAQIDQLTAERINGVEFDKLFNLDTIMRGLWAKFHNGSITVEDMVVEGNLQVDKINNNTVNDLFHKNPFEEDHDIKTLTVEGDVYCDAIEIDKLNSVDWDYFLDQLIFKNATDVLITGPKIFSSNFTVEKVIETKRLNNILLGNILRKEGDQRVRGPISIKGDVEFVNLDVAGTINEINLETLLRRLEVQDDGYVINGDVLFERLPHIQQLVVDGMINGKDPTETLFDIVYLDENITINGPVTFKGPVGIEKNLHVSHQTNNIDFTSVVENIARTTRAEEITGQVTFTKEVIVFNEFKVEGDLWTETLFQYNTTEWLEKAVFVNRGLLKGNYTFENITINNKLTTKYINDYDMDYVVPLKTDQVIEYLELKELTAINDIDVGNLVNGFDLEEEWSNTVMADLEQEITSDLIFRNNVLIYDTIEVETINDKNASDIVTINSDQNITASLIFNEECYFASNLEVRGLINGINITEWDDQLKVFSPEVQNVYQTMNVLENLTFQGDVRGEALIGGLDFPSIAEEINERRDYKYRHELDTINNYNATCTDIKYLYRQCKKQTYKFRYFERFQELSFHDDIQHVVFLELGGKQYLLVNEPKCTSQLMAFNGTHFEISMSNISTGDVAQVVQVFDGGVVYLVIRGRKDTKCDVKGTNIWRFSPNSLELRDKMEDQDLLQDSLVPNTFYGLSKEGVVEYKVYQFGYQKYRRWAVTLDDTMDFIPRGFDTGLALTSSDKIIFLNRTEPILDNYFDESSEIVITATFTEVHTKHVFGSRNDVTAVLNVGKGEARRKVLAVAVSNPETFDGQVDAIKVYEDVSKGRLFYQINTYKPSSIVSLEFSQAETLLIFMRDQSNLEVYEYKGIEKFKHKTSAKIPASEIIPMLLPTGDINARRAIGLVHRNKITILEAKTVGNRIEEDFDCGL